MRCLNSICLALLLIFSLLAATPAFALDALPPNEQIAALDRSIMLECIELARFNLHFHGGVNRKNFSQEWLYPMQRETGTALGFTNTIIDINERAKGLHNPSLINRNAQKNGVICALTGQAITGTSSSIQLLQNLQQTRRAHSAGFSPKASLAVVKASVDEINELLARRAEVVATFAQEQRGIYNSQARLLDHIKNQLVYEFKNWSVSSRTMEWSENTFYALDATQGFLQMSASCLTLRGFSESGLGGRAAILNVVGNSIVMFNPLVKHAAGKFVAARQRRLLDRTFPQSSPHTIDQILAEANFTVPDDKTGRPASPEEQELAFLIRQSAAFDGPLNREVAKVEKLRRIADQQAISGPLIGLTGVTRSVLNTVAYYQRESASNSEQSEILANQLNLSGRIVQSAGQAYSLVNTPYTELRHYRYKRALQKAGNLPSQKLQQRLALLDKLEARVKESKFERPL
jgi:hypothetical protein